MGTAWEELDPSAASGHAGAGAVSLEAPPAVEEPDLGSSTTLMTALPVAGSVGSVLVLATTGGEARTRALVAGVLFLLATVAVLVLQADRQRRSRSRATDVARHDHLARLAATEDVLATAATQQREALTRALPPPGLLPLTGWPDRSHPDRPGAAGVAGGGGVARGGGQGLVVRWGRARHPHPVPLDLPAEHPTRPDPVCAAAFRRVVADVSVGLDLPAALDLTEHRQVVLTGPLPARRALARALVVSAAASHPPDALRVACLHDGAGADPWAWAAWLPHAAAPAARDAAGPVRLLGGDPLLLASQALATGGGASGAPTPHLLLVVDSADAPADLLGFLALPPRATVLRLDEAADAADLVLDLTAAPAPQSRAASPGQQQPRGTAPANVPVRAHRPGHAPVAAHADQLDPATAEAAARALAGRADRVRRAEVDAAAERRGTDGPRPGTPAGAAALPAGLDPPDPGASWRPEGRRAPLRVVVGSGPTGPVTLDLEEPAAGGHGPHGLVVGTTGSGKSELLRTVVLGLAAGQPPEDLTLVLVDFKGGATFAGLGGLPHVAALITNLSGEATLVDRMRDALEGELTRRQEVLRAAGDLASVHEHEARRAAGAPLEPLPRLLVVVDEFAELLAARPDLLDLVVTLGRLGRSLGVHLLLATQRLEEGRLRGLESHLSVRVALRTSSTAESRAVIGVADAAALPAGPGHALLRTGPEAPVPFRAGLVSAPAPSTVGARRPRPSTATAPPDGPAPRVVRFTAAPVGTVFPGPAGPAAQPPSAQVAPTGPDIALDTADPTVLSTAVAALAQHARRSGHAPPHQVWLPPLSSSPTLADLLPDPGDHGDPGDPGAADPTSRGSSPLRLPVGVVDLPREQRREPLVLDLGGAGGHVAVVGGPRSGRSTTVQTLVCAAALTTAPGRTTALLLDLGGSLAGLTGLPHVAARVERSDPDGVRRVVAHARSLVGRREARAGARSGDGAPGRPAEAPDDRWGDGWGEVLLVVDGWAALRADHPDLEDDLVALAARGLGVGVHLVVTAHRWSELRPALRDLLGSRVELRLGDPLDSWVDRRAAAAVPPDRPGRGLRADGAHALVAEPRLHGAPEELVHRVRARWAHRSAPVLPTLPQHVSLADLRDAATRPAATTTATEEVPLAVRADGTVVGVPTGARRHLVVLGPPGSGRTTALRTALRGFLVRPPGALQVVLLDPRRGLVGEVPPDHLLDDLPGDARSGAAVEALAAHLRGRLPTARTTAAQLRDRTWWDGPEVLVVADDHDLLTGPGGTASGPLAPLVPLLPRATEVGLHLLLARRTTGLDRGRDPAAGLLRDLGAPVLHLDPGSTSDARPGVEGRAHPTVGRGRLTVDGEPSATGGGTGGGRGEEVQVAWTEERMADPAAGTDSASGTDHSPRGRHLRHERPA